MELKYTSIAALKAAIDGLMEEGIPMHDTAFLMRREQITKAALSTLSKSPARYAVAWCKELLKMYK